MSDTWAGGGASERELTSGVGHAGTDDRVFATAQPRSQPAGESQDPEVCGAVDAVVLHDIM